MGPVSCGRYRALAVFRLVAHRFADNFDPGIPIPLARCWREGGYQCGSQRHCTDLTRPSGPNAGSAGQAAPHSDLTIARRLLPPPLTRRRRDYDEAATYYEPSHLSAYLATAQLFHCLLGICIAIALAASHPRRARKLCRSFTTFRGPGRLGPGAALTIDRAGTSRPERSSGDTGVFELSTRGSLDLQPSVPLPGRSRRSSPRAASSSDPTALLYGTTVGGGSTGAGTIYALQPPALPVKVQSASGLTRYSILSGRN